MSTQTESSLGLTDLEAGERLPAESLCLSFQGLVALSRQGLLNHSRFSVRGRHAQDLLSPHRMGTIDRELLVKWGFRLGFSLVVVLSVLILLRS
jgi:hypothetical protein